jgi:DNA-binding GntR family transcriptional regulator
MEFIKMLDQNSPFLSRGQLEDRTVLVEKALRDAIIARQYAPGQRLSEVVIAKKYAVARTSIRGAFIRLAQSGFLSSQARSGWVVARISASEIRETTLGRQQLDPLLARAILQPDDLLRLETLCNMYAAITTQSKPAPEAMVLARGYEREILALLSSRLNAPMIARWLHDLHDRSTRLIGFFEDNDRTRLGPANWHAFLDAQKAGKIQKAADVMAGMVGEFSIFVNAAFLESDAALQLKPSRQVRTKQQTKPTIQHSSHESKQKRTT